MKNRKTLFFLLSFLSSTFIYSQVSIGIKGGFNNAKQITEFNDVELATGSISGIVLGALIDVPISNKVSLQPELLYMQKGSSLEPLEDRLKINYFEIPLLVNFKFLNKNNFGLNLIAGPSIGYALNGTISDDTESEALDFDDDTVERLDLPLQIGIGASTSLGSASLFAEYRVWKSMVNISKSDEVTLFNSGSSISIGLKFPMGDKE